MLQSKENLVLEAKNPDEFDKYVTELKEIVQGLQKSEVLPPEVHPEEEEIKEREDDLF
jgi:hypothetical protein